MTFHAGDLSRWGSFTLGIFYAGALSRWGSFTRGILHAGDLSRVGCFTRGIFHAGDLSRWGSLSVHMRPRKKGSYPSYMLHFAHHSSIPALSQLCFFHVVGFNGLVALRARLDAYVDDGCPLEDMPTLLKYANECVSKDVKHLKGAVTKDPGASALHIKFFTKNLQRKKKLCFFPFLAFLASQLKPWRCPGGVAA
jgi:hypothetical protein